MPKRRTERSTVGADATRRAARTLFQVGTVGALIQLYNVMAGPGRQLTADQVAALTTVGTILVSFLQNLLEENGSVPEMLKRPTAPPPVDPPLVQRELEALAAAVGGLHKDQQELKAEVGLLDDAIRYAPAVRRRDPDAAIFTEQDQPAPWPPGGLG